MGKDKIRCLYDRPCPTAPTAPIKACKLLKLGLVNWPTYEPRVRRGSLL
jgi:hypothetical protein